MVQVNFVFVFGLVLVSCSGISGGVTAEDMGRSFGLDCDASYSLSCFKKDIVSYIEKLSTNDEVNIMPGMSVVRDETANTSTTSAIVAGKYFNVRKFQDSNQNNSSSSRNCSKLPQ